MSKEKTLIERYEAIQKIGTDIDIPHEVWTVLGGEETDRTVSIMGTQICLGCDYVSIEKARLAVAWYVAQLGGTVKW